MLIELLTFKIESGGQIGQLEHLGLENFGLLIALAKLVEIGILIPQSDGKNLSIFKPALKFKLSLDHLNLIFLKHMKVSILSSIRK